MKPKVIKKSTTNSETGCCFRSCGGSPCVQDFEKKNSTKNVDKRIKKI
jgi:hypothetical protein